MKKLAFVLVSSVFAIGSTGANIATGFFAGFDGGYGATTGKLTQIDPPAVSGSVDMGAGAASLGLHIGYGWVTNCVYWGGELGYTFENIRVNDTLGQGAGTDSTKLKRPGYFNAALRGGYLFTPNTMMYIRLGGNWSHWTLRDSLAPFSVAIPGTGSKNRLTFVPGFGMETAVHKHVYVRVEYTYEFGPGITAANTAAPGRSTSIGTIRCQTGKVGLSYKF